MSNIGTYRQQPSGYKAFVLSNFPPKNLIKWDDDLIMLLSSADRAIGKLNAIDQLVPDIDFFIFMYVRKEAALSSQIEGTQATFIDYIKAEAKLADQETPSDVDEIRNYINAMNYGINRLDELPLCSRLIKGTHKKLLEGVRGQHKHPGEFRKSQNWIGGPTIATASFVPPPPFEMKELVSDLEKFFYDKKLKIPPLVKAGIVHSQFETIHPFLDGNGRTGRLLITFYLYKEKVLSRPILYISDYFKKYRSNYYDKLNSYRFDEGINNWLKFFLEGVRSVSEEAVVTAKNITHLRERDLKKVSQFGKNSPVALGLLEKLFSIPIVDAKSAQEITGLSSKANINALIEKFIKANILSEMTGKARNRRYIYKDYVAQFSKDKI
jgi:Fic family protein